MKTLLVKLESSAEGSQSPREYHIRTQDLLESTKTRKSLKSIEYASC